MTATENWLAHNVPPGTTDDDGQPVQPGWRVFGREHPDGDYPFAEILVHHSTDDDGHDTADVLAHRIAAALNASAPRVES